MLLSISTHHVSDCLIVAKSDDAHVEELIREYDRRNISNKETVRKMLLAEHGINMRYVILLLLQVLLNCLCPSVSSARTVARRRKAYGLLGAGATTRAMPLPEKRQLVLDELAKDPLSKKGPKTIGEGIVFNKGVHLTR